MASSSPALSFSVLSGKDESVIAATCSEFGLTPTEFEELRSRATKAKATAYCPYSEFRVGAALLTNAGKYIEGANIENVSYPVGTCAERVAFGKAVTDGHRDFKAVAVATDVNPPTSPCGMCRQFIREFCDVKTPVIMFDKDGNFVVRRLEELLPLSFGPGALPPPSSRR